MTNNKRDQDRSEASNFQAFMMELAALVGRFVVDFSKLMAKGAWLAYRSAGNRQQQTAEPPVESAPPREGGLFGKRPQKPAKDESLVDVSDDSDPEAAALLEDFLQQTAAEMQQRSPADEPAAEPIAVAVEAMPPDDEEILTDELPPLPQKDITYKTEEEQQRIADELRQREERLKAEEALRHETYDEKEARRARLQAAVEADRARIKEEQRQRQEAFERAEAERKRREAERHAATLGNRLQDTPPDDSSDDDIAAPGRSTSENQ